MIRFEFDIPIYEWNCQCLFIESKKDLPSIREIAGEYSLPDKEELLKYVEKGGCEGGKTYTKRGLRKFLVVIFKHYSIAGYVRTINHEKRHIIDDILEWQEIKDKEAAAYLDGWLSEKLYNHLKDSKIMKK